MFFLGCSFFMIAFASYVEMQAEDNFKQTFSEWLKVCLFSCSCSYSDSMYFTTFVKNRPEQRYGSKPQPLSAVPSSLSLIKTHNPKVK